MGSGIAEGNKNAVLCKVHYARELACFYSEYGSKLTKRCFSVLIYKPVKLCFIVVCRKLVGVAP